MLRQVAAKAVLWNDDSRVLILRKPDTMYSKWELPGGRLEADELLEDGLKREVAEETGIRDIHVDAVIGGDEWTPTIKGEKVHIVALFLTCHTKATDVILSEEHDDYAWVSPGQLADYEMSQAMRAAIERSSKASKHIKEGTK